MSQNPDLTDRQKHLIHCLPASASELADELGVPPSTIHTNVSRLRDKGIDIPHDGEAGVYHLRNEDKVRRIATKHTGTKTREANNWATEQESAILRRLRSKEPAVASTPTLPGREDMVVHLTDCHMGDVVEDERGREVFNSDICEASIEHVTDKALELKELMSPVSRFDTCHLLWGGDMVTNENIYDGQAHDIELLLADQLSRAIDALVHQAKSLANAFNTVQIVAQPGNHGKTRASGVSKQANVDLLAYRWIHDRLIESDYDNINFLTSEATFYRNFELRDGAWRAHLRHGQDAQQHVDATAASSRDWRGWQHEHQFAIAYRGHFHSPRLEYIMNQYPVIMAPSMKPGDEFASRIGRPDVSTSRKLAAIHGVSDDRPITWHYFIDDKEMNTEPT